MKKVFVVGGGTAGWFTALLTKKFHPDYDITLIESSEIGILGAGEGSVPFFINILDILEIPVVDLIRECKATFKIGFNYVNWNGDGKSYFHSFIYRDEMARTIPVDQTLIEKLMRLQANIITAEDEDFSVYEKMAKENLVPFTWGDKDSSIENLPLNRHGQYSLHFDARLLAVYLAKFAMTRGIGRIESKVSKFTGEEIINSIILEDGTKLDCDFVFDCSGFARLIHGKHHKTKWISHMDVSGLDRAMPFFIDHDDNISPVTDAFCLRNGWCWRIPVQGRYGCGYVYNSKYCSDEEALAEVEEFFGQKLVIPKIFKFEAGIFEKTVVGNSMAVGLAQSFLEPIEATNIWVSTLNVVDFLNCDGINNKDPEFAINFNERCLKRNTSIVEFVYLHYMTKRRDSPFWRDFSKNYPPPENVVKIVEQLRQAKNPDIDFTMFSDRSWMQILQGLRIVDLEKYQYMFKDFYVPYILNDSKHSKENKFISHKELIDRLVKIF